MGVYIKAKASGPSLDPDAEAFLTAASITDSTQKNAINNLVVNMKAAGIWSKMKAVYPFIGGTASTHKWNLKDPQDTNAAFRLVFFGGWTHTANGVQANGTNGYANTFFVPSAQYAVDNNHHISVYSRLNQTQNDVELGSYDGTRALQLRVFFNNATEFYSNNLAPVNPADTNSVGNYIANRIGTAVKIFKNNTTLGSFTNAANGRPTVSLFLANSNNFGSPNSGLYSNKQFAFASIGDGLTDTEALVFNQIVEGYQYELSRNVNPVNANYYNTAYNNETNAFLYASEITDDTQKTAVDTLITDLKTANIWTKMKAIYPFVGGTASTHKWNLKDPQDTDAAFRLVFNGGWTHDANGVQGNGVNGYADTKFNPSTAYSVVDNGHFSIYSRLNQSAVDVDLGVVTGGNNYFSLAIYRSDQSARTFYNINISSAANIIDTNSVGFYNGTRIGTAQKGFKNGVIHVNSTVSGGNRPTSNVYISTINSGGPNSGLYSNKQYAFASIGDGLTDTEAADFYTAVQNFNTTLNRQV